MKERPVRSTLPTVRFPAKDISQPREMDSDYMTKLGEVKLKEQENVTHCCIMLVSEENVLAVLVI